MDASAGSSPQHSKENPAKQHGGGRGKAPAVQIAGEAADEFLFADDTFPSLPDFPCLSSPSSSTFSSSSSSNSSCAFTTAAGSGGRGAERAAGEPSEPASADDGIDALADIDQLLDFASLSVPWDDEPLFPDVDMMVEEAISEQPPPVGDGAGKAVLEAAAGGVEAGEACMGTAAGEDLPRFFMDWLTSNRDSISAEDLRSIRLRRSTIEAAAARLGGGRQGTMQLLKLILTWVQNHHLQKKRTRAAMEDAAGPHGHCHGQLPSPGANPGYEFPSGGQEMSAAATSWMPYQAFTPPAYGGEAIYPSGAGPYPFQQSCSTSSVVVASQPFSPPPAGDMHAVSGGNMAWPLQYAPFPGPSAGSYPMAPPVVPQPFAAGLSGQYPAGGHPICPQPMTVMEPSATKEARKKRMARQRRLSCLQQQRSQQLNLSQIQTAYHPQEPSPNSAHSAPVTPSSGGCRNWGPWSPGAQAQAQNPLSRSNSSRPKQKKPSPEAAKSASGAQAQQEGSLQIPSPEAAKSASGAQAQCSAASDKRQGPKTYKNLQFLLQKVLKQSDVGGLGRIVLPKKEAEIHLPELKTRDGISIPMEDIATSRVWNMRYRFWPNNKSRMYLLENTGDFVRSNELQEGDFIVIYSDVNSGKYLIRGVKVRTTQEQGKHNHGFPEKGSVSDLNAGAEDRGDGDGAGKPDGCKGKSPHGVRRSRQEATSMSQMAVSI